MPVISALVASFTILLACSKDVFNLSACHCIYCFAPVADDVGLDKKLSALRYSNFNRSHCALFVGSKPLPEKYVKSLLPLSAITDSTALFCSIFIFFYITFNICFFSSLVPKSPDISNLTLGFNILSEKTLLFFRFIRYPCIK